MKVEIVRRNSDMKIRVELNPAQFVKMLRQMAMADGPGGRREHIYISEACQHLRHASCGTTDQIATCAECGMPCMCECHAEEEEQVPEAAA